MNRPFGIHQLLRWLLCACSLVAEARMLAAQEDPPVPPVAPAADATNDKPAAPQPQVVVRGRAGTLERLPPRPELSPEERAAKLIELRALYSQPPERWPPPLVDEGVPWRELGLLPTEISDPPENPWTAEKAALGKQFFFDPRLSSSGQIACASCHDPDLAWADGRTTAFGHARKPLRRNTPSVMNAALFSTLFWDGRAPSLEAQATAVLMNPHEMRASDEHLRRLLDDTDEYRTKLQTAYGVAQPGVKEIAGAIASFERTIVGGRSRFDTFLRGRNEALDDNALAGLHVFRTTARCMNCHHGPAMTDGEFHNLGLSYYGRSLEDRGKFDVSKLPADVGRFRTPSLRNVSRTAPYMHNGIFPLTGVLNLYNAGATRA